MTTPSSPSRLASPTQRRARGRAQREACPFSLLAKAPKPGPKSGRDPIDWLDASNNGRVPELLPVRHARMVSRW